MGHTDNSGKLAVFPGTDSLQVAHNIALLLSPELLKIFESTYVGKKTERGRNQNVSKLPPPPTSLTSTLNSFSEVVERERRRFLSSAAFNLI